ncbi:SDR family NAD(P)-dependent oxidoreductase [Phenylobacterium sp. LjRoot164]|uniref:SDR family oxidoreductase n=1 Tax=unclassified Phenylobacterium TaxID=2640670 RepID=UPI003ECFB68B
MQLRDRTILVTGGARGIGLALTRRFLAEGAVVIAAGRDGERLARLHAQHPRRVTAWPVDLSDPQQTDAFVRDLPRRHPELSVVVNNAGAQTLTDFLADDVETLRPALRREISLNLDAVVAISTGLLEHLRRQPSAAIVNVTSGLALAPKTSSPVYCATKAAVRSFTKALRYQCEDGAPNVQVIEAVMALVDTDMTAGRGQGKITPTEAADEVVDAILAGRREVYVDRAKLLPILMRVAPGLGERIMRRG